MYRLTYVSGNAVEPVSLVDAKAHLRKVDTHEDDYINTLITAAREYVEMYTNRAMITQTWKLILDKFPTNQEPPLLIGTRINRASQITIPKAPLQSITHVKYYDTNGTQQTRSSDAYVADTDSEYARLYPAHGYIWPETRTIENAVEIQFVAGYGDAATDVPATLKHAMKLLISHWFELRDPVVVGSITKPLEFALESLLWSERIVEVPYPN